MPTIISIRLVSERRALIGKRISWRHEGWLGRHDGVVQEVRGNNMRIDGDWKWSKTMVDVQIESDNG